MKTVTYDPAVYKLVPIEISAGLSVAGHQYYQRAMEIHGDFTPTGMFKAMLAVVPDALPGVVVHSGKPAAYSLLDQGCRSPDDCEDYERLAFAGELTPDELQKFESAGRATKLFTHPPAQPDTNALKARIAELEAQVEAAQYATEGRKQKERIAELEAQIAAQAGQEVDISVLVNRFLGWPLPKTFAPDCGISFDGRKDDEWNKNKPWPIGTNLLTAIEAKTMFEHVLAVPAAQSAFPERDTSKPAEQQGIFHKFDVRRTDGSSAPGAKHHNCRYFVFDLDHDTHGRAAMTAYGLSCAATHPQLSAEILQEFPVRESVAWQSMDTAPKDGRLLRLLVKFEDNATEDSEEACATIGANSFDHTQIDEWQFAGWNWSQDCFTEGIGTPIGWLPMLDVPLIQEAQEPQADEIAYIEACNLAKDIHAQHYSKGTHWRVLPDIRGVISQISNMVAGMRPELPVPSTTWGECERISNVPAVTEALEGFSMDSTADNAICLVRSIITLSTPAPASAIAIVQAALEAAAKICDGYCTEGYAAQDIRALNPKSILDGMSK